MIQREHVGVLQIPDFPQGRQVVFLQKATPPKDGPSEYLLVGGDWNITFIFPYIGNVIILIDELIFFGGVGSTTNQIYRLSIDYP